MRAGRSESPGAGEEATDVSLHRTPLVILVAPLLARLSPRLSAEPFNHRARDCRCQARIRLDRGNKTHGCCGSLGWLAQQPPSNLVHRHWDPVHVPSTSPPRDCDCGKLRAAIVDRLIPRRLGLGLGCGSFTWSGGSRPGLRLGGLRGRRPRIARRLLETCSQVLRVKNKAT
jgi:hypothetical protein